jgi:hypothetical protein
MLFSRKAVSYCLSPSLRSHSDKSIIAAPGHHAGKMNPRGRRV